MDLERGCFSSVRVAAFNLTHFWILLRDTLSVVSFELVKAEFNDAVLVIALIWSKAYGYKGANEMLIS